MPTEDELTAFLQSQTTWRGESPGLFRTALDAAPQTTVPAARPQVIARIGKLAIASIAAVLLVAISIGLLLPTLGKARGTARITPDAAESRSLDAHSLRSAGVFAPPLRDRLTHEAVKTDNHPIGESTDLASDSPPSTDRLVIRKATIELLTADVRAAFSKAQHLLRVDLGEYAETSTLNGENETAQAQLTLRVAADRLSAVLTELRPLGKVQAENSTGDDVTSQAVDFDARLRNERRVECEVLELLESRKDAPLKEILDLRDKLSQIRQSIETMQARRDTLGRQVALATILVIIRADAKPVVKPEEEKPSFFDQLGTRLDSAAGGGARSLISSLAFLLEILIAGAFWWLMLVIVFVVIRRHLARQPKVSIGPDLVR